MTVVLLPFPFCFFLFSPCTFISSKTTLITLLPLLGISPLFCPSIFDGGGCDSWGFKWRWQIVIVLAVVRWITVVGFVNPPFFLLWALPLFIFQPNTSSKFIFALIKPIFFIIIILDWFLVVAGWSWVCLINGLWVVAMAWLCWANFLLICVWYVW